MVYSMQYAVCSMLYAVCSMQYAPIILLTAKGEASERVEGLETGADDYLPKPFEPKELILRI